MTCRELVDFLMAYLEDELAPEPRAEFERHLEECPPCVAYLETYREAVRLGKGACADPEGPAPAQVPEALLRAILAARRR